MRYHAYRGAPAACALAPLAAHSSRERSRGARPSMQTAAPNDTTRHTVGQTTLRCIDRCPRAGRISRRSPSDRRSHQSSISIPINTARAARGKVAKKAKRSNEASVLRAPAPATRPLRISACLSRSSRALRLPSLQACADPAGEAPLDVRLMLRRRVASCRGNTCPLGTKTHTRTRTTHNQRVQV